MFKTYLELVSNRQDLTRNQASQALKMIIEGEVSATEIGGFLVGLRVKGESVTEILGFVDTMEEYMVSVPIADKEAIDVCGTGGDGTHSFNVSTTVALVVAAGGVTVAKHGNRSISSKSGSADVLQCLGVKIDLEPEKVKECVDKIGIGFFFAPLFHPAMKVVALHRKNLGMRTVFNMLGPLLNPARVKRQLIGTYDLETAKKIAGVLMHRGYKKACTVHSRDGFDEISPFAENFIFEVSAARKSIKSYQYRPSNGSRGKGKIRGSDMHQNARIIRSILAGEKGPARDMTVINAAFAFYVAEKVASIEEGIRRAEEAIDTALVQKKLQEFVEISNDLQ